MCIVDDLKNEALAYIASHPGTRILTEAERGLCAILMAGFVIEREKLG